LLERAKWMRANPTEAERRLWSVVRAKRLAGFKFRRQAIIEPYIVDLVCFAERMIIEADGSQHADNRNDARRDAFPRAEGFRLLRFWNNQVLAESEAVAAAIHDAFSAPSPFAASGGSSLSRKGRGATGAHHA
jgi:very-short-patch-repair endonuclease